MAGAICISAFANTPWARSLNGLALSKLRVYGSTFLIFSDYMKPAIRLSALMGLPVIYIFTHNSIGLGEDGPTHQPIEQLVGAARHSRPDHAAARRRQRGRSKPGASSSRQHAAGLSGAEPPDAADLRPHALRVRRAASRAAPMCWRMPADGNAGRDPDRNRQRSRVVRRRLRRTRRAKASPRASSACRPGSCSSSRTRPIATACCRPASRRACRSRPASVIGWDRYVGADRREDRHARIRRVGADQPI